MHYDGVGGAKPGLVSSRREFAISPDIEGVDGEGRQRGSSGREIKLMAIGGL